MTVAIHDRLMRFVLFLMDVRDVDRQIVDDASVSTDRIAASIAA